MTSSLNKKITIAQIASMAGVSIGTVSRAINGNGRISESTRSKIKHLIAQTGFVPDHGARRLARGANQLVGLAPASPLLRRHYYSYLQEAIQETFFEHGFVVRQLDPETDVGLAACAGFIVPGLYAEDSRPDVLKKLGLSVVVIGYSLQGCGSIEVLQQQGVLLAMQHLFELGHRMIAHVGGFPCTENLASALMQHDKQIYKDSQAVGKEGWSRYEAYRQGLTVHNLDFNPDLVANGGFSELDAYRAVQQMLMKNFHFTAVFAASDEMALGTIRAIEDFGLRVPEDISVIGFDDLPFAAHMQPALSTVRQPIDAIGRMAAQILIEHLEGAALKNVQIPTQLVLRNSTAVVNLSRAQ